MAYTTIKTSNGGAANVRADHSTSSTLVGTIAYGTSVNVVRHTNGWLTMRKARYYVSDNPKTGFKLHPAFIHNGIEQPCVYLSAYEGTLFDTSANAYILDDSQVADFAADKLCSIANAKPASGSTQNLTRRNCGKLAENRGSSWFQSYAALISASQLLFLVEYASFNTQTKIGNGNVNKPWLEDGVNYSENTGATATLGNASGNVVNANGFMSVTYRGEKTFGETSGNSLMA